MKNWKRRSPPVFTFWLHTRSPIFWVWQHPWPKLVTREKDGQKSVEVWSGTFNSWEPEDVLRAQYRRNPNGEREKTPTICPMSLLLEEIDRLIHDGKLDWKEALFRFQGDDPNKAKTLHAGSMINMVNKVWDKLSDAEKGAASKIGLSPKEAWKGNMMAKCNYVFAVVDNDDPDKGVQVTIETTLVGEKTRKAIGALQVSLGDDKGNPMITPYAIQWSHHPNATQFQDKYEAVAIQKIGLTDRIRELIVEKDPPSLDHIVSRGDIVNLRASMESAYIGPEGLFDWDALFAAAEKEGGVEFEAGPPPVDADGKAYPKELDLDSGSVKDKAPQSKDVGTVHVDEAGEPVAAPDPYKVASTKKSPDGDTLYFAFDGVELFACDNEQCDAIVRATDASCPKCGYKFEEQEAESAPEPKPTPMSKRTSAPERAKAAGKDKLDF